MNMICSENCDRHTELKSAACDIRTDTAETVMDINFAAVGFTDADGLFIDKFLSLLYN